MALDDKEQKILAEIERQFYDEDPELAHAVRNIHRPNRIGVRFALLGVIVGLAVIVVYFSQSTLVAILGFALLVGSATALVSGMKARQWREERVDTEQDAAE
jgi:hypothetical protein